LTPLLLGGGKERIEGVKTLDRGFRCHGGLGDGLYGAPLQLADRSHGAFDEEI
jgi:hypothetical protein